MNNRKMVIGITVTFLIFQSCHIFEEESLIDSSMVLVNNRENINKLIQGFDNTLNAFISSDFSLHEEELGEFFIQEVKELGVKMVEIDEGMVNGKISYEAIPFSEDFIQFSEVISNPSAHPSNVDYIQELSGLLEQVKTSNIPLVEKQILVDNLMFMDSFVNWLGQVDGRYKPEDQMVSFGCEGWWACWGRCVAGTAGSALSGAALGCAGVGVVGATIGAVGGIKGAAAGALIGCTAGGIVNGIGKGLVGYAEYCY